MTQDHPVHQGGRSLLLIVLFLLAIVSCVRPAPGGPSLADENREPTGTDSTASLEVAESTADPRPLAAQLGTPVPGFTGEPTPDSPRGGGSDGTGIAVHTVAEGETLSAIAIQYESSLEELLALNEIGDANFVYAGQQLRVPVEGGAGLVSPSFKIIPDSELVYGPAAKEFDLRAFAEALGGYLVDYQEEVEGQTLDGPEIVQLVADRHSVNPRLLLAALEFQSGWLTKATPAERLHPLGSVDENRTGLYRQLSWAANLLNWGYYGRAEGGMGSFYVGELPVSFAADINDGTAGAQHLLAAVDSVTYGDWEDSVGADGLFATYSRLFGNPFGYAVEPLVPADLVQPPLQLPWSSGETWYFTGGPHGGWNTGAAWAALDFGPPDVEGGCFESASWVTAVADGTVTRSGLGAVVVDLDGDGYAGTGWAVTYMHLDSRDRVAVGTEVKTGDRLGHPGCEGGFSNGTHLHIARTYNGRWISADGTLPFNMDGWISSGQGVEYNGWLTRDGLSKTADIFREPHNAITAD